LAEIVYILINETMPGLVKIGRTNGDLAGRIRSLHQTGVPLPFELFYACEVNNSQFVERQLHEAFGDHRVSKSREFFRLAPERAKAALSIAAINEVRLGDEIFETAEDKAEVEAAKRRSRFQFSMLDIKPGTILKLYRDPNIICATVDEKNRVDYKGAITSLSDAALQAVTEMGFESF
jgi:hypothetical protein